MEALLVVQLLNVVEFRERAMQGKTLVVLSAVAVLGVGSTAMAKGGMGMGMHGHGHFVHHFNHRFRIFNRFNGNPFLFGGGWDWGLGGYGDNGNNTTVVVSQPPVSRFPVAGVSTPATPCRWNAETFNVPSSAGGKQPVEVVSCR
jgi:hypothetical protein